MARNLGQSGRRRNGDYGVNVCAFSLCLQIPKLRDRSSSYSGSYQQEAFQVLH
jgi:hypothetical protein